MSMRVFSQPIAPAVRAEITAATQSLYAVAPGRRTMQAQQFAMEGDPGRIVATEAEVSWPAGRLRIAHSHPEERPPFEWIYEITSDVGESDYFKHYLIRDNDIVLAQRKVLTPIDQAEADVILADLAAARQSLQL